MTTKRPLADISLLNESRKTLLVIWATKASGVAVAGDWAVEENAPATSIQAAAAHKKAITSLIIKNI
jgi:hypothetical protein